jgi:hypothetical protein
MAPWSGASVRPRLLSPAIQAATRAARLRRRVVATATSCRWMTPSRLLTAPDELDRVALAAGEQGMHAKSMIGALPARRRYSSAKISRLTIISQTGVGWTRSVVGTSPVGSLIAHGRSLDRRRRRDGARHRAKRLQPARCLPRARRRWRWAMRSAGSAANPPTTPRTAPTRRIPPESRPGRRLGQPHAARVLD